jgi:hypothetical protein
MKEESVVTIFVGHLDESEASKLIHTVNSEIDFWNNIYHINVQIN